MTVLMFHKRFAGPIQAGTKQQTIRPPRKRPIKVGDSLSLRMWEGQGYRSPMVTILESKATAVFDLQVFAMGVMVGISQVQTDNEQLDRFAQSDGFESWRDMREWYLSPGGYGLPFTGVLIQWIPILLCEMCGQKYSPDQRPSLKGICVTCSASLGGSYNSAQIMREEKRAMKKARA